LSEKYEVSSDAVHAIENAKQRGGRVIAVGTTVTRALESAAAEGGGHLIASSGRTELLLGPRTRRRVVDGIMTGVHDAATSHFTLLESFANRPLLERAHALAEARGYRGHEFGDAIVIL
jgi:S-adenosylmethionine:tRNA ribosyltransferase-isomerase